MNQVKFHKKYLEFHISGIKISFDKSTDTMSLTCHRPDADY